MANYFCILVAFVTFWCSCYGLNCYVCDSKTTDACGEPFNETTAEDAGLRPVNCTDWALNNATHPFNVYREPKSCFKIYSYNTGLVKNEKQIVGQLTRRQCSFVDEDKAWHKQGVQGGAYQAYCKTDGCNHSNQLMASIATLLTLLVATCLIR